MLPACIKHKLKHNVPPTPPPLQGQTFSRPPVSHHILAISLPERFAMMERRKPQPSTSKPKPPLTKTSFRDSRQR